MMHTDARADALHRRLVALNGKDRLNTVDLIKALMQADSLRLYAMRGYDSLYAYCRGGLKMDEGVIYLRIAAARCARRFDCILPMLQDGSLSMTAVHLLRSSLTEQNHRRLLTQAQHKTKRQILQLVADEQPKQDVPERIRQLPAPAGHSSTRSATANGEGNEPGGQTDGAATHAAPAAKAVNSDEVATAARPTPNAVERSRSRIEPLGTKRYGVHFTASEQLRDKLTEAQDLLSHLTSGTELATVIERAVDELLKALRKRKYAETDTPRPAKQNTDGARGDRRPAIPAQVRRAVYERDGGRCTFVSPEGHRCGSRRLLEFHHIHPVGKGGSTSVEALTLHCRAHNQLAAERDYGPDFMQQRVAQARRHSSGAQRRTTLAPQASAAASKAESDQPDALSHARAASAPDELSAPVARPAWADSAKATCLMATVAAQSLAPAQVPLPARRPRRREPRPECVVLPGQLALPMAPQCHRLEQNEATAPAATATRPAAQPA